jgi:tRNA dimethylallyltransferase
VVGGTGLYLRALWGEAFDDLPHDPILRQTLSQRSNDELYAELQTRDSARAKELHPNDGFRIQRALEILELTGKTVAELRTSGEQAWEFPPARVHFCDPPRAVLHERIERRIAAMLEAGFEAEVAGLLQAGCSPTAKPMLSIGYKQMVMKLTGEISADECPAKILFATRQYAKRQCTWFRRYGFKPEP